MPKIKKINNGFICKNCGYRNPKAEKTCRNHCKKCLYSLHVDDVLPGDRLSQCKGLMKPIVINHNSKKGYIIIHQCVICGKTIQNKTALDDSIDTICLIMKEKSI